MSNLFINVWYGSNENAWLSNLAERPFSDKNGREYVTVEHAYQTFKSGQFDESIYRRNWAPGVKIVGKKGTRIQDDWNIRLMERLVLASFDQNPDVKDKLVYDLPVSVIFTHRQDRGVWKKEFPRILHVAKSKALAEKVSAA